MSRTSRRKTLALTDAHIGDSVYDPCTFSTAEVMDRYETEDEDGQPVIVVFIWRNGWVNWKARFVGDLWEHSL